MIGPQRFAGVVVAVACFAAVLVNSGAAVAGEVGADVVVYDIPEPLVDLTVSGLEVHGVTGAEIQVFDGATGEMIRRVPAPGARRITWDHVLIGDGIWYAWRATWGGSWGERSRLWKAPGINDIASVPSSPPILYAAHDRVEWWDGLTRVGGISAGEGEPLVLGSYRGHTGVMAVWGDAFDRIEFFIDHGDGADLYLEHERTLTLDNPAGEPIIGLEQGPDGGFVLAFPWGVYLYDTAGSKVGVLALPTHEEQREFTALATDQCGSLYLSEGDMASNGYGIVKAVPSYHDPGCFLDGVYPFQEDISWFGREGITRGCNPPLNDRFCPDSTVTRGQMAAFLSRALNLPSAGSAGFTDTAGSVFAVDIDKLANAGITKGCNPPANDRYCPEAKVTRGQMAAFLVRALGYTDNGGGGLFVDDDDSIFEGDIDR